MPYRLGTATPHKSVGPVRRVLQYAFYDWTREMPRSRRIITWAGLLIQVYAVYAGLVGSLIWPLVWPKRWALLALIVWVMYGVASGIMSVMLTSEFVRKTQLEGDQIAARQIQQTLQPQNWAPVPGYEIATFYQPFRDVGGDYFDVIELDGGRMLFAIVDVSGKGMPAALLAANVQALVRSIASTAASPLEFAHKINLHLNRYTPSDRFATAVFAVLDSSSGQLAYVNAGHNPPVLSCGNSTCMLNATGVPLGLMSEANYETGTIHIPPRGMLLLFTDGLTDSIEGNDPEERISNALQSDAATAINKLKALMNPKFSQDDVTLLLVQRAAASA
jgi:serine phosphatase RsbU (regulator of sigma subunit)